MSALFNAAGQMQETEKEIPVRSLPVDIQSDVSIHFKGSVIKKAALITKSDGEFFMKQSSKAKTFFFR